MIDSIDELIPTDSYLPTGGRMSLPQWIVHAGIIIRGKRYSLKGHEYLKQILEDTHPDQSFEKAAQVAISTLILIKSLYVSDHLGKKVVYYFQDDNAVSDFSADRANPMIESSQYLLSRVRGTDRVGLKHVGPGSLFFRGLWSRGKVKSLDCDMVVLDELDEAKDENIAFAKDRLLHSDLQWVFALSQPSHPGFGIDREFNETDQHYWFIICQSCGHRNQFELNFPENFIPIATNQKKLFPEGTTHYRGCSKCGSRLNMANGEWIAKNPSKTRRGYHLSQLYTQVKPAHGPNYATRCMAQYESSKKSQNKLANFQISWLGFPFAGGSARVTPELLEFISGEYGFSYGEADCFMGVDQGDVLTISIATFRNGKLRFVYFEETEDWSRLDWLMSRFGVRFCVIDAQPNKYSAKSFASRHRGHVAIQYFAQSHNMEKKELLDGKIEIDAVLIDRTESIDSMIDRMEQGLIEIPSKKLCSGQSLSTIEDVWRHAQKLVAKYETTPSGLAKRVYIRGHSIENHFGMSMNNACLAAFDMGKRSSGTCVMPIWKGFGNA